MAPTPLELVVLNDMGLDEVNAADVREHLRQGRAVFAGADVHQTFEAAGEFLCACLAFVARQKRVELGLIVVGKDRVLHMNAQGNATVDEMKWGDLVEFCHYTDVNFVELKSDDEDGEERTVRFHPHYYLAALGGEPRLGDAVELCMALEAAFEDNVEGAFVNDPETAASAVPGSLHARMKAMTEVHQRVVTLSKQPATPSPPAAAAAAAAAPPLSDGEGGMEAEGEGENAGRKPSGTMSQSSSGQWGGMFTKTGFCDSPFASPRTSFSSAPSLRGMRKQSLASLTPSNEWDAEATTETLPALALSPPEKKKSHPKWQEWEELVLKEYAGAAVDYSSAVCVWPNDRGQQDGVLVLADGRLACHAVPEGRVFALPCTDLAALIQYKHTEVVKLTSARGTYAMVLLSGSAKELVGALVGLHPPMHVHVLGRDALQEELPEVHDMLYDDEVQQQVSSGRPRAVRFLKVKEVHAEDGSICTEKISSIESPDQSPTGSARPLPGVLRKPSLTSSRSASPRPGATASALPEVRVQPPTPSDEIAPAFPDRSPRHQAEAGLLAPGAAAKRARRSGSNDELETESPGIDPTDSRPGESPTSERASQSGFGSPPPIEPTELDMSGVPGGFGQEASGGFCDGDEMTAYERVLGRRSSFREQEQRRMREEEAEEAEYLDELEAFPDGEDDFDDHDETTADSPFGLAEIPSPSMVRRRSSQREELPETFLELRKQKQTSPSPEVSHLLSGGAMVSLDLRNSFSGVVDTCSEGDGDSDGDGAAEEPDAMRMRSFMGPRPSFLRSDADREAVDRVLLKTDAVDRYNTASIDRAVETFFSGRKRLAEPAAAPRADGMAVSPNRLTRISTDGALYPADFDPREVYGEEWAGKVAQLSEDCRTLVREELLKSQRRREEEDEQERLQREAAARLLEERQNVLLTSRRSEIIVTREPAPYHPAAYPHPVASASPSPPPADTPPLRAASEAVGSPASLAVSSSAMADQDGSNASVATTPAPPSIPLPPREALQVLLPGKEQTPAPTGKYSAHSPSVALPQLSPPRAAGSERSSMTPTPQAWSPATTGYDNPSPASSPTPTPLPFPTPATDSMSGSPPRSPRWLPRTPPSRRRKEGSAAPAEEPPSPPQSPLQVPSPSRARGPRGVSEGGASEAWAESPRSEHKDDMYPDPVAQCPSPRILTEDVRRRRTLSTSPPAAPAAEPFPERADGARSRQESSRASSRMSSRMSSPPASPEAGAREGCVDLAEEGELDGLPPPTSPLGDAPPQGFGLGERSCTTFETPAFPSPPGAFEAVHASPPAQPSPSSSGSGGLSPMSAVRLEKLLKEDGLSVSSLKDFPRLTTTGSTSTATGAGDDGPAASLPPRQFSAASLRSLPMCQSLATSSPVDSTRPGSFSFARHMSDKALNRSFASSVPRTASEASLARLQSLREKRKDLEQEVEVERRVAHSVSQFAASASVRSSGSSRSASPASPARSRSSSLGYRNRIRSPEHHDLSWPSMAEQDAPTSLTPKALEAPCFLNVPQQPPHLGRTNSVNTQATEPVVVRDPSSGRASAASSERCVPHEVLVASIQSQDLAASPARALQMPVLKELDAELVELDTEWTLTSQDIVAGPARSAEAHHRTYAIPPYPPALPAPVTASGDVSPAPVSATHLPRAVGSAELIPRARKSPPPSPPPPPLPPGLYNRATADPAPPPTALSPPVPPPRLGAVEGRSVSGSATSLSVSLQSCSPQRQGGAAPPAPPGPAAAGDDERAAATSALRVKKREEMRHTLEALRQQREELERQPHLAAGILASGGLAALAAPAAAPAAAVPPPQLPQQLRSILRSPAAPPTPPDPSPLPADATATYAVLDATPVATPPAAGAAAVERQSSVSSVSLSRAGSAVRPVRKKEELMQTLQTMRQRRQEIEERLAKKSVSFDIPACDVANSLRHTR